MSGTTADGSAGTERPEPLAITFISKELWRGSTATSGCSPPQRVALLVHNLTHASRLIACHIFLLIAILGSYGTAYSNLPPTR